MAFAFKKKKHIEGIFKPLNTNKYMGNRLPTYRSSYERSFMRWADNNPNVVKWGSENIAIPYLNPVDNKIHLYIVDNFILLKQKDKMIKFLVEIKPAKYTVPPTRKKQSRTLLFEQVQYAENFSKWKAAKHWCKKNGCEFVILTEAELGLKKH